MDVVFVDGIHYAVKVVDTDADGNEVTGADLDKPLTWHEDTKSYVPRDLNRDPLHNEQHGTRNLLELIPGSED